jgi:hypothetical protein
MYGDKIIYVTVATHVKKYKGLHYRNLAWIRVSLKKENQDKGKWKETHFMLLIHIGEKGS